MSTGLFKNVHYDRQSNSVYVWEYVNGRGVKRKVPFENKYFVKSTEPTDWKDVDGNYVKMEVVGREGVKATKKKHDERSVKTHELSYDEESKFLLWRYGEKDSVAELKDIGFKKVFNVGYYDIETASEGDFPEAKLSPDEVCLVTIICNSGVHTFSTRQYTGDSKEVQNYYWVLDEKEMLERVFEFITSEGIDILSGWYSNKFDFPYLFNRYAKLNPECVEEDEWKKILRIKQLPMGYAIYKSFKDRWEVPGLTHIDYKEIYEKLTFEPHDSYSLDYVSNKILGKGKLDYEGSIQDFWKNDWNRFVEYNIIDTKLIKEINDKIAFIELYVTFAYSSLIPISRCESSIAQIEGYVVRFLRKDGVVMPDIKKGIEEPFEGGYVHAKKGYYEDCFSEDATSLYPSIDIQWNISPETLVLNPTGDTSHLISTPRQNQFYRKDFKGLVPKIIDSILTLRAYWKKEYNKAKKGTDKDYTRYCYNMQINFKVLANSIYGALAHPSFVFYNINNASIITEIGRNIIRFFGEDVAKCVFDKMKYTQFQGLFPEFTPITESIYDKCRAEYKGINPILQDTDSFFVCLRPFTKHLDCLGIPKLELMHIFIDRLFMRYSEVKGRKWSEKFNVNEFRISFKLEKIIDHQFIFAMKKYVSYMLESEGKVFKLDDPDRFSVTGLEIKRTDTSPIVQEFSKQTLEWIIEGKSEAFITSEILKTKEKFSSMDVNDICLKKGVKDVRAYHTDDPFGNLPKGTPIANKLAMQYNQLRKTLGIPNPPAFNGSKLRYVFVNPRNRFGVDSIAWVDKFPEEYLKHFRVDEDKVFEKSVMAVMERTYDVMGWEPPKLINNGLSFG